MLWYCMHYVRSIMASASIWQLSGDGNLVSVCIAYSERDLDNFYCGKVSQYYHTMIQFNLCYFWAHVAGVYRRTASFNWCSSFMLESRRHLPKLFLSPRLNLRKTSVLILTSSLCARYFRKTSEATSIRRTASQRLINPSEYLQYSCVSKLDS